MGKYRNDFFYNGKCPQEEIKAKKINKKRDCILYVHTESIQTYCTVGQRDLSCLMAWDCHQQGQGCVSSSQQEVLTLFATNLWPVADADHSIN